MLEASDTTPLNAPDTPLASDKPEDDSLQAMRALIERMQGELQFKQSRIEALNFEIARLKRWRFGSSSESLDSTQAVLFDALVLDTALEDRAAQGEAKAPGAVPSIKHQAVRQALPANLPRIDKHYEIEQTHCACGQAFKRIGQEVSEQHASSAGPILRAAPHPGQVRLRVLPDHSSRAAARTDHRLGAPAPGLLAQVVVAKHDDHLPLYRQSEIYARSGVHISRSSMAQWVGICGVRLQPLAEALKTFILGQRVVHADETPLALLFDFCASRAGEHPRRVLKDFGGTLVTDD